MRYICPDDDFYDEITPEPRLSMEIEAPEELAYPCGFIHFEKKRWRVQAGSRRVESGLAGKP